MPHDTFRVLLEKMAKKKNAPAFKIILATADAG
jgi:hypothetical protein